MTNISRSKSRTVRIFRAALKLKSARTLAFIALMLLAAALRFSHLDIAHFQLDQARTAQLAWDIARAGEPQAYYFPFTGGYHGLPLALYLWAPAYLLSTHVHALLAWNIVFSLIALALTWLFAQRYWSWRAAAVVTLLFATSPWHVWYAHRLWSLMQMSPFVMLWLFGTAFALHERRPRFWCLSWGMAVALVQLHASGVIFLAANGLLWLMASRENRSWRWAALGILLALIPVLPWLLAHFYGEISIQLERLPLIGEGKQSLQFSLSPLIDFLAATEWRRWFRGGDWSRLEGALRPLELVALPLLLAMVGSAVYICQYARRGQDARLQRILALWLALPVVVFPFVTYESNMLVYYYPLLPAPFIAIALAWEGLPPRWKRPATIAILILCGVQANAALGSAAVIRNAVAEDDDSVWAVGGGAPLATQLEIADLARLSVESSQAQHIYLLTQPVYTPEYEYLAHSMPLLTGLPVHVIDLSKPHSVYPADASLLVLDSHNTALPAAYAAADETARSGPFRLYRLPGNAAPQPDIPLPENSRYANGIQLLGHGALHCRDAWRLHWRAGDPSGEADRAHFFVHLLDAEGQALAQRDSSTLSWRDWLPGDTIITDFDFGKDLSGQRIDAIRVGLYRYSLARQAWQEAIYALDEAGNPWLYAVDIPYGKACDED